MTKLWPSLLGAIQVVQPETILWWGVLSAFKPHSRLMEPSFPSRIEGKIMRKFSLLAAALLGLVATTPARADVEVGTLSCRSSAAAAYIVFSGQPFRCTLTPFNGGPVQYYQAVIHRFGAQVGFSNDVSLAWAVFAPTAHIGPGSLAGGYGGVSAGAAVGIGVGANGLVGGANSVALQPLSVQGEIGLNIVATVTGLELEPVLPVRHHRHYRRHPHYHS